MSTSSPRKRATSIRDPFRGNYERLVEVKTRIDPGNLFRLNKNVAPRGGVARA